MHPPSIMEMKHGHICKHSKIFLEQKQDLKAIGEEQARKGVFYHPKIECKATCTLGLRDCEVTLTITLIHAGLDTHPARMNTHLYTVHGGAIQDQGLYVYLIDEHKN